MTTVGAQNSQTTFDELVDSATVRRIVELGYIAAYQGFSKECQIISSAVGIMRPKSAAPHVGQAMAAMQRGDLPEAICILRFKAMPLEPENLAIKAMMCLYMALAGQISEAQRSLDGLLTDENSDQPGANLVRAVLDLVSKNRT
ncbi:MAG: tetratricopeptide repeat protein [Geminicoccaceae bacterium]